MPTTVWGRDCIDRPPDYGRPTMTIAYCVLAHRSPEQTRRLVSRLLSDDPDCLVLLHFDQRHATMDQTNVAGPRVRFLRERPIYWGCPEIVDVFVEMFNLALQAGCSHAVMLSGQDYPLRNVAGLGDELGAWDVWANMGPLFSSDGTCNWDEGRRRYTYEWYHVKEPKRAHKAADRVLAKLVRAKSFQAGVAVAVLGTFPAARSVVVGCPRPRAGYPHLLRQYVDEPLSSGHERDLLVIASGQFIFPPRTHSGRSVLSHRLGQYQGIDFRAQQRPVYPLETRDREPIGIDNPGPAGGNGVWSPFRPQIRP